MGDFFRVGALAGFVRPWDEWLQRGMQQARATLGDRWETSYMSAPIWRFTLSAGTAGPHAVTGVLMPSVDRLGREFPLTLVAQVAACPSPMATHLAADETFALLEDAALSALEDSMTRDGLAEILAGIPEPVCQSAAHKEPTVAHMKLPGIWSADLETAPMMVCDGLPSGPDMCRLFDPFGDLQVSAHGGTTALDTGP